MESATLGCNICGDVNLVEKFVRNFFPSLLDWLSLLLLAAVAAFASLIVGLAVISNYGSPSLPFLCAPSTNQAQVCGPKKAICL